MPGTVTVACALPHGFRMQAQEEVVIPAPSREDANRKEKIFRYSGPSVVINGPAPNRDPKRIMDGTGVLVAGGFAITPGVDKDLWERWREQMKDWPPLVAGQVFAREREDSARGEAREGKGGASGFEPFNPSNPPSEFAGKIKTAEKQGG